MGVASGPEPRHMWRYLPRHDLYGIKANMASASHASVWDGGYFPPCAVAVTCGIGVRPRASSRVSMPVRAHPAIQGFHGVRRESRRERRRRVPEEHVHPRVGQLLQHLHARTLESRSPASQPVGISLLFQTVPSRAMPSQPRRTPSPAAPSSAPVRLRIRVRQREGSAREKPTSPRLGARFSSPRGTPRPAPLYYWFALGEKAGRETLTSSNETARPVSLGRRWLERRQ